MAARVAPLFPSRGWRDAGFYRGLLLAGRPALAWEVLRRNPGYAAAAAIAATDLPRAASPAFTQRWGLHFRH